MTGVIAFDPLVLQVEELGSPVRASAESNEVHGLPRWGNLIRVDDM